jgi:hypothetical protein
MNLADSELDIYRIDVSADGGYVNKDMFYWCIAEAAESEDDQEASIATMVTPDCTWAFTIVSVDHYLELPGFYTKVTVYEDKNGSREYDDWYLFTGVSVNREIESVFTSAEQKRDAVIRALGELCMLHFSVMHLHVDTVEFMATNGYRVSGLVPKNALNGKITLLSNLCEQPMIEEMDAREARILLSQHRTLSVSDLFE